MLGKSKYPEYQWSYFVWLFFFSVWCQFSLFLGSLAFENLNQYTANNKNCNDLKYIRLGTSGSFL